MKIIECAQNTLEWFQARIGIPTSSNFDKILDASGKPSKQREKYLYQLAGELVAGKSEETYQNAAMLRGIELEAEARAFYEFTNSVQVQQVGFCLTEGKTIFGASPDGLVGKDGAIEIKCPLIYTHVGYLLNDQKLPTTYFQQVQGQLLVTERKWVDFISYYAGLKPMVVRVIPDKEFQTKLQTELDLFCKELKEIVSKIK